MPFSPLMEAMARAPLPTPTSLTFPGPHPVPYLHRSMQGGNISVPLHNEETEAQGGQLVTCQRSLPDSGFLPGLTASSFCPILRAPSGALWPR